MGDTLIPVIVGGVLATAGGLLGQLLAHRRDKKHDRRSLSAALSGEIGGICAIARRMKYVEHAEGLLRHIRETKMPLRFRVPVTANYMVVFEANAGRLGNLPPNLTLDVVRFYTQVRSLLENVRENGPEPENTAGAEWLLSEQITLLNETLDLGNLLVQRLQTSARK